MFDAPSSLIARTSTARGALSLAIALGIGLLIGAERERRKGRQPDRFAAGIRTFAIAALAGAVSLQTGGIAIFAVTTAVVGALATASCWAGRQSDDPGITTEVSLILTLLLGGLAMRAPSLAAMTGVTVAILLAARTPLHRFVGSVLTEREVNDAMVLAGATLIVFPLLPDRAFGPYSVLNPRSVWLLVILVLSVSAMGHVAVRLVGVRFGLPLAGLLSGFVSSAATVGAMGARARAAPSEFSAAAAAAVLSTVATMLQLGLVLGATSEPTMRAATPSLLAGGVIALLYGLLPMALALKRPAADGAGYKGAFSLVSALVFATTVSIVLLLSAACRAYFGEAGLILAAAVAGLVDAHASAISMASLVVTGQISAHDALTPILVGVSTNTITKLVFASTSGGRRFLIRVAPGLLLVVTAVWLPPLVGRAL
jgi:uncharacterized membrane protein (DUF4010 family)